MAALPPAPGSAQAFAVGLSAVEHLCGEPHPGVAASVEDDGADLEPLRGKPVWGRREKESPPQPVPVKTVAQASVRFLGERGGLRVVLAGAGEVEALAVGRAVEEARGLESLSGHVVVAHCPAAADAGAGVVMRRTSAPSAAARAERRRIERSFCWGTLPSLSLPDEFEPHPHFTLTDSDETCLPTRLAPGGEAGSGLGGLLTSPALCTDLRAPWMAE